MGSRWVLLGFWLPVGLVVTADHGEKIGKNSRLHGIDLDEPLVRVPLVISDCGFTKQVVTAPVSLVDLSPTILGMTRTPAPGYVALVEQAPVLRAAALFVWRFTPDF